MILKIKIGRWKIVLTIAPVKQIIGVNSTLPDGKHILMWDFDDVTLKKVAASLRMIQLLENLPNIYILETKPNENYIAYCFHRVTWEEAVKIVANTPLVCYKFFKWGVYRRYWTLRISEKNGTKPKLVKILESPIKPTASPLELQNFVKYLIFEPGYKNTVKVLNIG